MSGDLRCGPEVHVAHGIESIVEALIVGACHELRSRPANWLETSWYRASALAVIEYHAERERQRATMLCLVFGGGMTLVARYALEMMTR